MTERGASRTAVGVAMLRAAHVLLDSPPRILDDTVVVAMLGDAVVEHIRERAPAYREARAMALRAHVLLRSRFAEERLHEATRRGVTQFVLLGAGLDTFAYRQPPWASGLRIFEVDHPASQAAKRERLALAGMAIPSNVVFTPVDFETDTLERGLERAGFDQATMTFVSCLGVLVYLTREAIDAVFAFVASLPAGSECVFTYGGSRSQEKAGEPSLATVVESLGEPFQSIMELKDVSAMLLRAGLSEPTGPSQAEILNWLGRRSDGLEAPKRERLASVVVASR